MDVFGASRESAVERECGPWMTVASYAWICNERSGAVVVAEAAGLNLWYLRLWDIMFSAQALIQVAERAYLRQSDQYQVCTWELQESRRFKLWQTPVSSHSLVKAHYHLLNPLMHRSREWYNSQRHTSRSASLRLEFTIPSPMHGKKIIRYTYHPIAMY